MKENFKNLAELAFWSAKQFDNKEALNYKKNGQWQSFSNYDFLRKAIYFALALKENGFKPGSRLAVYAYQNPIWLIADFGAILAGGVSVPIFHNVSKENLLFQLKDAGVDTVFADFNPDFYEKNYFHKDKVLASELPRSVKNVICFDFDIKDSKLNIFDFEAFLQTGKQSLADKGIIDLKELLNEDLKVIFKKIGLSSAKKQDLATIVYTSGSTGRPKGVELSHENLTSQVIGAGKCFDFDEGQVVLSFLPLAHIFERMVMMLYISKGVSVYFVDDVNNLGVFLKEIRPTAMTVVPRMLEKVFAKIKSNVQSASFLKKKLALAAMNRALSKDVEEQGGLLDSIFDCLVYKKYRDALGGKMEMMICGGAALSGEMERFFRNIGVNLYCGYGLTETSPVLAVNYKGNCKFGTVGKIFEGVELKVAEDGELLARGKNIMLGYHNQKTKTKEVMDGDWFKTGDLAKIDEDGFVVITGRKKELFKTSNGKYVRPIPIEQRLVQDLGFLVGALIIAEGRNFVSAILFPDFELLRSLLVRLKFAGDEVEFLESKNLQDFVKEKIDALNLELDRSEQIFKFVVIKEQISIASGDITPSMKLKRSNLEEKYYDKIEELYKKK